MSSTEQKPTENAKPTEKTNPNPTANADENAIENGIESELANESTNGNENDQKACLPPARGTISVDPQCFLPQKTDKLRERNILANKPPPAPKTETERADFSALANLVGTRPEVHRLTQNRFSIREWREHNNEVTTFISDTIKTAQNCAYDFKRTVERTRDYMNSAHDVTNTKLHYRVLELHTWRGIMATSMEAMCKEIGYMEEMEQRVLKTIMLFALPASIAQECLDVRNFRATNEMVRDEVEDELRKELVIVADARALLDMTLADVKQHLLENRSIKNMLDYNMSEKGNALAIDWQNINLHEHSQLVLRSGTIKNPPGQTSPENWEAHCQDVIKSSENARMKSLDMRKVAHSRILGAATDIRNQADIVERTLIKHIECMKDNVKRYEMDYDTILNLIRDTEFNIIEIRRKLRCMDQSMKIVQNRLDNRTYRENVDNCRDSVQENLMGEASVVHTSSTAFIEQLRDAENSKDQLIMARKRLQSELNGKLHALFIDRDRCMELRSFYPNMSQLASNK